MSNSQLNKLKAGIKNGTAVTSNSSSDLFGDFNDKTNSPYKFWGFVKLLQMEHQLT